MPRPAVVSGAVRSNKKAVCIVVLYLLTGFHERVFFFCERLFALAFFLRFHRSSLHVSCDVHDGIHFRRRRRSTSSSSLGELLPKLLELLGQPNGVCVPAGPFAHIWMHGKCAAMQTGMSLCPPPLQSTARRQALVQSTWRGCTDGQQEAGQQVQH